MESMSLAGIFSGAKWLKWAIAAGIVFFVAIFIFAALNGNQKAMVKREAALTAKYQDNQNVLSNYKTVIKEAMGVAQTSTAAQNKVLEDAIKGRYELGSTASPQGGSAFSAIFEQYPNLDKVAFPYEKVQTAIFSGREAFKNQQTALLDLIREYDTWRNSGFIHSILVDIVGAPSGNLEAAIGDDVVTGEAALARMKQIIITSDTKDTFKSGEDEPLDLGPTDEPVPAPTLTPAQ